MQNITPALKVNFFPLAILQQISFLSVLAYFNISSELIELIVINRLTTESLVAILIYNNYSVTML